MQHIKVLFGFIVLALAITGCSQINKASDFITKPSAKEIYQRDYKISDELFELWDKQFEIALQDSIQVELPYTESGKFFPKSFSVYSYEINLKPGEVFSFEVKTDSVLDLVFAELYENINDTAPAFRKIEASEFGKKGFNYEIEKAGIYKLVVQPEIAANSGFQLELQKHPAYKFPVASVKNTGIQSLWGAARDGGARRHEGIDIFASRGTPVVAATDGRITYTGEKGLGGKQVWLQDSKRNQSLYYAHLDSIRPVSGRVKTGDTLGFVGNTGNARTTPPHLHFGIYKSYRGAIDPFNFVYQITPLDPDMPHFQPEINKLIITGSRANLRNRPTTANSRVIGNSAANDTLTVLGKTKDWFHIRTAENKASFVHESLASPI